MKSAQSLELNSNRKLWESAQNMCFGMVSLKGQTL